MTLGNFFDLSDSTKKDYRNIARTHLFNKISIDDLAILLAEKIVGYRCQSCMHHFEAWKNKLNNNTPLSHFSYKALRAFIVPTFGDPDDNSTEPNIDHLEGFIGEWLWYFLLIESPFEKIVYDIPPGFQSTDPGGDSFYVFKDEDEDLSFRLWEMKKFAPRKKDSSQDIRRTINNAYKQLNGKALEYLARIVSTEQDISKPDLKIFIGGLVDMWIDASPHASSGISITTSNNHITNNCFDNFIKYFPNCNNPNQLLGMITGVDDFSYFVQKVKEIVWKGL